MTAGKMSRIVLGGESVGDSGSAGTYGGGGGRTSRDGMVCDVWRQVGGE